MPEARRHAVILGLDGMPLYLLKLLAERGVMPYTRRLLAKAFATEIETFIPFTPPSWTTISTGVKPGKHGIYDSFVPKPDGGVRIATKNDVGRPLVNEIAAYQGMKTVCVNVPYCYPPLVRQNNVVISSWLEPKLETWPSRLKEKVSRILGKAYPRPPTTVEEYVDRIKKILANRIELLQWLYTSMEWQLFYVVLPEPDWLFHYTYGEIVRATKIGKRAYRAFTLIDKFIKFVYSNAPERTLIVVVSDHGFTEARVALNANTMLKKMGLVVEVSEPTKAKLLTTIAERLPSTLKTMLKYRLAVPLLRLTKAADGEVNTPGLPIDYERSVAFFTNSYMMYVNRALPVVKRKRITKLILKLLRKTNMFKTIGKGEELYPGPYSHRAPDIVAIAKEGYNVTTRLIYTRVIEKGTWYIHHPKGMLLVFDTEGSVAGKMNVEREVTTADVTPTILTWLGLPLDKDFDGKPLVFKDEYKLRYRSYKALTLVKIGKIGKGM